MTTKILLGDCRDLLKTLPDESVHCCVTSPPYWGLRDYGTASWEGGDAECDHQQGRNGSGRADGIVDSRGQRNRDGIAALTRKTCDKCGARRIDQQIGLESTPEEYVANLVDVFREVRRVLRKDGTCWVNLGDSYAASTKGSSGVGKNATNKGTLLTDRTWHIPTNLKPKDLVGIPWRVAFALQADGWWLRQDIIWAKPNPMPESVTDRCTKSHEYVFLLAKSERYWYDAKAVSEDAIHVGKVAYNNGARDGMCKGYDGHRTREGLSIPKPVAATRNRRSVWTVATQPYSGAHFATFPPALIEPMILAGCPEGGTVLDPFAGSGTTGQVAERLGRHAILIELNPDYLPMAVRRTAQAGLALGAA